jgi:hypothetical protein
MDNRRDVLADYRDQRLTITGMYDKCDLQVTATRQWRVALLQDVYAEIEGKQIDLGHIWVQHAEPLRSLDLKYGDRIRCNCRVTAYKKRLRVPNADGVMVVEQFSLSFPTEIEVLSRGTSKGPPEVSVTADEPEVKAVNVNSPVNLILELKQLAERAGGWNALRQLVDVLAG